MSRRPPTVVECLECRALLSAVAYSLATDRPVYSAGDPVAITLTETNVGDQVVTITPPADVTVSEGGTVVWESALTRPGQSVAVALEPGQSTSQTVTWTPALSLIGGAAGIQSGSFIAACSGGPSAPATIFRVTNPIAETLTTDRPTYTVGSPVWMTFTITNDGDQPVEYSPWSTAEGFSVYQGSSLVWMQQYSVSGARAQWLQPGQSASFRAFWDSTPDPDLPGSPTGTFTVVTGFDPDGPAATFQLVDPTAQSPPAPASPPAAPPSAPIPSSPPIQTPAPPAQARPAVLVQVTGDHGSYRPGQPVRVTLTLKNRGNQEIVLTPGAGTDGVSLLDGSTVIDRSSFIGRGPGTRWLRPGRNLRLTAILRVGPRGAELGRLNPGTYTVVANEGGYTASAAIRIRGR